MIIHLHQPGHANSSKAAWVVTGILSGYFIISGIIENLLLSAGNMSGYAVRQFLLFHEEEAAIFIRFVSIRDTSFIE